MAQVEIPATPDGWHAFHIKRAEEHFVKYLQAQAEIAEMEDRALEASPNRAVARKRLLDDNAFNLHSSGRTYKQLCDLRDMYMSVASLSASMIWLYTNQAQLQQASRLLPR